MYWVGNVVGSFASYGTSRGKFQLPSGEIEAGRRRRRAAVRCLRRSRDDGPVLVLGAVSEKEALCPRELMVDFQVVRPSCLGALERSLILRPEAFRVHGEELVFLRALVREEIMGLVLDDRSANRAAVLVPPVVRLR